MAGRTLEELNALSIEELIALYTSRKINVIKFVDALLARPLTFGRVSPVGEGEWIEGEWDEVRHAHHMKQISDLVFCYIAKRLSVHHPNESIW